MHAKTIRWQQRFENFERAFQLLERTVAIVNPTEAERGGLIQFFETAFELAWKTLKDYLESEGVDTKTPRETIKQAFQAGLLADGHVWIKMLDDRNVMSHTYDDEESQKVERLIRNNYFPQLKAVYQTLKAKA